MTALRSQSRPSQDQLAGWDFAMARTNLRCHLAERPTRGCRASAGKDSKPCSRTSRLRASVPPAATTCSTQALPSCSNRPQEAGGRAASISTPRVSSGPRCRAGIWRASTDRSARPHNTSGIVLVQGAAAAVTPAEAARIMGKAFRRFGAPQQATPRGFRTRVRFREIHAGRQFRGGDALRGFEAPPLLSKRN